ncbi:MAG: S1 RNA-binding domain-containing protein [Candidatus Aenigmatarchaeota archaeon]
MRKRGKPNRGEMVICRITKIHPNSAFAELIEYKATGMIHASEVAKKWVRDIREFLKKNQYVVCRVMGTEDHTIALSVKRVHRDEANRKLNEFKRERRAEKMFEQAAKSFKKSLEEAYEEVGYTLIEGFGSLVRVFEACLKHPDLLARKAVPKAWQDALMAVAQKSYVEKTFTIKARLKLVSYQPDGVEVIKGVLKKAADAGFQVRYISAPAYEIVGKGKNYKELEARIEAMGAALVKEIEKTGGEGSFSMEK